MIGDDLNECVGILILGEKEEKKRDERERIYTRWVRG
jgi:hypothetical protein